MTMTTPPAVASKRCATCRELPARCRCGRSVPGLLNEAAPAAAVARATARPKVPKAAPPGQVKGRAVAAGATDLVPVLLPMVVMEHAAALAAGRPVAEWLAALVLAARPPAMSAAERKRASRARKTAPKPTKRGTQ